MSLKRCQTFCIHSTSRHDIGFNIFRRDQHSGDLTLDTFDPLPTLIATVIISMLLLINLKMPLKFLQWVETQHHVQAWPLTFSPDERIHSSVATFATGQDITTHVTETSNPFGISHTATSLAATTIIPSTTNNTTAVELAVYNIKGQLIHMLVNNTHGERVPSGVYFYRIKAGCDTKNDGFVSMIEIRWVK